MKVRRLIRRWWPRPPRRPAEPTVEAMALRVLCHELRAPISSLTSVTRALSDDKVRLAASTRAELVQLAHDQARHLDALLVDARVTAAAVAPSAPAAAMLPLHRVLSTVLDLVPADRLHLTVTAAAARTPVPAAAVQRVLTNLLDNARRHGPGDAEVELTARIEARTLVLGVTNPGRADAVRAALRRRTQPGGLHGLGLWIVRALVTSRAGTVTARQRGASVEVEVRLPIGRPLWPRRVAD
jgi:two-component system, OmpR family, sensor kinase